MKHKPELTESPTTVILKHKQKVGKLTELTMPLSAWKPSLTGNTWSLVSAITASCWFHEGVE